MGIWDEYERLYFRYEEARNQGTMSEQDLEIMVIAMVDQCTLNTTPIIDIISLPEMRDDGRDF